MSNRQIKKLAGYIVHLRGRMKNYQNEGNEDLVEYCVAKIEAAREIAIVFGCREEVFRKVEELEDNK